jgi:ubiquinol-cytochrome c reductase cytochrome b subunit
MMARIFTVIYFTFFLLMPIYTRWEKTKPVPRRVTEEPDAEDQYHAIVDVLEEMTIHKPLKTSWGATAFPLTPDKSGIKHVLTRLAKRLKGSLD